MYEKKGIKILHVDDEESQLLFTEHFLQTLDDSFIVDSISDPREALRQVNTNRYDIIVSDYKMDKLNGVQLAIKIKKKMNIPFILYTGQDFDVMDSAIMSGVDYYVKKEIDPSHYHLLYKRIHQAVETNQTGLRKKNGVELVSNI